MTATAPFRRQLAVLLNINNMEKVKRQFCHPRTNHWSLFSQSILGHGSSGSRGMSNVIPPVFLPGCSPSWCPFHLCLCSCLQRDPITSILKFLRYHANQYIMEKIITIPEQTTTRWKEFPIFLFHLHSRRRHEVQPGKRNIFPQVIPAGTLQSGHPFWAQVS